MADWPGVRRDVWHSTDTHTPPETRLVIWIGGELDLGEPVFTALRGPGTFVGQPYCNEWRCRHGENNRYYDAKGTFWMLPSVPGKEREKSIEEKILEEGWEAK